MDKIGTYLNPDSMGYPPANVGFLPKWPQLISVGFRTGFPWLEMNFFDCQYKQQ